MMQEDLKLKDQEKIVNPIALAEVAADNFYLDPSIQVHLGTRVLI